MSLIKANRSLNNFDQVLQNFLGQSWLDFAGTDQLYSRPAVNIKENEANFELELAIPGLNREDVTIKIENNNLIVEHKRQEDHKKIKDNYRRREFAYNGFKRSFKLPDIVHLKAINANYKDGILQILLPKVETAIREIPRSVEIS